MKDKIKIWLKFVACFFLYYTGLNYLYALIKLKNKGIILTYHRVLKEEEIKNSFSQAGMIVSDSIFEKQLNYLRRTFKIISLEELISSLKNGKFKERFVIITFDDGWRDVYSYAFSILKNLKIPAIIFISTGFFEKEFLPWTERLGKILLTQKQSEKLDFSKINEPRIQKIVKEIFSTAEKDKKLEKIDFLIETLKRYPSLFIENVIEQLSRLEGEKVSFYSDNRNFLKIEEMKEMRKEGILFGSHTVNHTILTKVSIKEAEEEIIQSKQQLEEILGEEVWALAYPNGDYNEQIKEIVKKTGYKCALTLKGKVIGFSPDLFELSRKNIHKGISVTPWGSFSKCRFACELSGILEGFKKQRL